MIYPTRRAVILCAAGVPLALIFGVLVPQAWFAGMIWALFVVSLVALDTLTGTPAPDVRLGAPAHSGVGAEVPVEVRLQQRGRPRAVEVAIGTSPLLEGARSATIAADQSSAHFALTATRRGTAGIERVWLRWTGALGLAWRQASEAFDARIRIVPDVRPVRSAGPRLVQRDALFGLIAQLRPGEGAEFESLTDYRPGMDRRAIDWKQSARHHDLLVKQFRTERNNNIVFAIDTGRAMCEPLAGVPRVDRAVTSALLAAYVALKSGDRVKLFGFAARPQMTSGSIAGMGGFATLQRLAADLDYRLEETNFTLGLATLAAQLDRRSLIVVFTEFTDSTGVDLMLRSVGPLMERHLVLFVVLRDVELDELVDAAPETPGDVVRAVAAASLIRERRIVATRLRRRGVHVIETSHDCAGIDLVDRYLEIKRRNLL